MRKKCWCNTEPCVCHTLCRDHDEPTKIGCLKVADPKYTMDFTDVEPGAYIYWCSACGPDSHKINETIKKVAEEDPGFVEKFANALKKYSPS